VARRRSLLLLRGPAVPADDRLKGVNGLRRVKEKENDNEVIQMGREEGV
jgi:hypothetical protein